jgi:CheY-like chemotaxis protein
MNGARPLSIMLIEDNQADVFLIEESLRANSIDFELTRFDNGDDALRYLHSETEPHVPRPDVIVLDMHLPGTEGQDILRVIRDEPWLAGVPIAVISGLCLERVRELDLAGSTAFIHKSMDVQDYLQAVGSTIRAMCRLRDVERLTSKGSAPTGESPAWA